MSAGANEQTSMFELEARRYDDPDVTRLVAAVQAEYVRLYGRPDPSPADPAEFVPPAGLFLVGLLAGAPVAMGGWRRLSGSVAEIRRMYVVDSARRSGMARRLLAELERTAAAAGVERLVLETGPAQPAAVALYENAGYLPAPGFGHWACHPNSLFYGKDLDVSDVSDVSRG